MITRMIGIATLVVALNASVWAGENTPEKLKKQMETMAKTLESDNVEIITTFIKTYASERDVKRMEKDPKRTEKDVKSFMKRKKKMLRDHLLAACKMNPKVDADKVTYRFSPEDDPSKKMTRDLAFAYSEKTKRFHLKN